MKKIQKFMKKNWITMIVFAVAIIITAASTFYATETIFASSEVSYDNTNSTLTSTNVQDALDELYAKAMQAGEDCPTGYEKRNENQYSFLCAMPSEPRSCADFTNDSWETIVARAQAQQTYQVGCTKEVTLGNSLGTHTLRVANNTTPEECNGDDFSQTACGFVLEFVDIVTTHRMNPFTNGSTSVGNGGIGGWYSSEMRTFLNTSVYNSLPNEIKDSIIEIKVLSGHEQKYTGGNYSSIDNLYLLSYVEVYGSNYTYDTLNITETRQLDYYANLDVTSSNYAGAIKKKNGSNSEWWMRSAYSGYNNGFLYVRSPGDIDYLRADNSRGVAPAFRIG